MSADFDRLRDIFHEAVERHPPDQWEAYLDRACAGDEGLRGQAAALLRAHAEGLSVLNPGRPRGEPTALDQPAAEVPGASIGPYKLVQEIGEGGMGSVWMAQQQEPVKRLVALKVIKAGMDSRQVLARFEAERQALALMDHPHIARVLDAGATPTGRPYFVMELVKGTPVTRYCDEHRLTPKERLGLFVQVCQAVQHAHQKGIIHRDIKPSNVLVAPYDGQPVVKVIDFGVAKAAGQPLTEKTLITGFGAVVGTPEYMSPEQAELNNQDVDTRSDIYSLGVLLYELLTGTTPLTRLRVKESSLLEVLRLVREEEPPRPSTRLSTTDELPSIAANRGLEPRKLSGLVRGELDWIVMKALEKERNRRYETALGLVADVQRYLHDEPVLACPPSTWYRFRKFARRHTGAFLAASAVAVAVLLAVGVLVSALLVLQEEKKQTQEALKGEQEASYFQRIALAGRELAAGNVGRAEELLDDCPEPLRGWEWHFLKRQRYGNAPPFAHPDTVLKVVFSPDGRQIASGCRDGTVRIWDAERRREPHTLPSAVPLIRALVYSPDGLHLAAGSQNGVVRVWKVATGELLATLRGHEQQVWGPVWQVAFSPDSRTLATACQDGSVRLWDMSANYDKDADRLIGVFPEHPAPVKGVAFSPDGGRLLAACRDGTVKTWDVDSGRELSAFRRPLPYVENACFSPDAQRLAWSSLGGVIQVWDTATQQEMFAMQSNTHFARSVTFSSDGRRIALAGFDGTIRLMDGATGRERLTIYAHPSLVSGVAFSPDGNKLASASYDQTLRIWDATPLTRDPLAPHCVTLRDHKHEVTRVAFSPDGRWLASSSRDGTVKVWELPGNREPGAAVSVAPGAITLRYTLRGHSDSVNGVAFSPDSRTLASASWDSTAKLWDLEAPEGDALTERGTIRLADRASSIGFSPDGRLLAVGLPNGIALYDPTTGKERYPFKRTATPVPDLAFSPDSRRLYSAAATDPSFKVWEVAGEKPIFEIRHYANPSSTVAVSADGRLIASPGRDQVAGAYTVKIWDAQTRAELRMLKGHVNYVFKVAFSPDSRYLASGSWDSTVKVWDLKADASAEPVTLRGHAGFIRSLAFSPDGRRLASASGYAGHGEVKVWHATLWESKASGGR